VAVRIRVNLAVGLDEEEFRGDGRDQQKIVNHLVIVTVTEYNSVTVTKSWGKPCHNQIK